MQVKAVAAEFAENGRMLGTTLLVDLPPPAPVPRGISRAPALAVFLPKEHGSWSLALEPLALGLLAAPSAAGPALATAALAGFLSRRPLTAAFLADSAERRRPARLALGLLGLLAIAGLMEAGLIGGPTRLWPLLLAAPLGGLFVYFDFQKETRAASAELVGCATFAFLPAALASLAGWSTPAALALTAVALARSIPTVLTVRTYLRLEKQPPPDPVVPLLSSGLALGGLGLLASFQLVPWLAAGFMALLLLRTGWLVSAHRPSLPAKRLGLIEALLGLAYISTVALAYRAL